MTWMGMRANVAVWYVFFLYLSAVFMDISCGRNLWTVYFYFMSFSMMWFIFHNG